MCGRFVLFRTDNLSDVPFFDVVHTPAGVPEPRYNIAPTTTIPILRPGQAGEGVIEPARWGLIPQWKESDSGPPLFNARAETVRSKPSFRGAFTRGRCAIPLDGYYEWKDKQPYFIRTGQLLWAAAIADSGLGQVGAAMITTQALPPLESIHHRMPRFLSVDELELWLLGDEEAASALLSPKVTGQFLITPADVRVGNVRHDFPELLGEQVNETGTDQVG